MSDTAQKPHFETDYEAHVANLKATHSLDEAMSLAVGGTRAETGPMHVALLRSLGMHAGQTVIDLGCGSGRTAEALAKTIDVNYLGIDVVQDLLDYAEKSTPPEYRFIRNTKLTIPATPASADWIFSFSLFTHLQHEETYLYMRDAFRVLKPGGRLFFSFLEFGFHTHWAVFDGSVEQTLNKTKPHMNTFIERSALDLWAKRLGFTVDQYIDGTIKILDEACLGQTGCVMTKPAPAHPIPLKPV